MRRRNGNESHCTLEPPLTAEEAEAVEQGWEAQRMEHVKEVLTNLWKQGRISIDTRMTGENALSAALHAIENPGLRNLTPQQGMTLANEQWLRESRRNSREF